MGVYECWIELSAVIDNNREFTPAGDVAWHLLPLDSPQSPLNMSPPREMPNTDNNSFNAGTFAPNHRFEYIPWQNKQQLRTRNWEQVLPYKYYLTSYISLNNLITIDKRLTTYPRLVHPTRRECYHLWTPVSAALSCHTNRRRAAVPAPAPSHQRRVSQSLRVWTPLLGPPTTDWRSFLHQNIAKVETTSRRNNPA